MWYVPVERIANIELVKRNMQVTPIWFDKRKARPKPIRQCDYERAGYVGFPVWRGMQDYPDKNYIDDTSRGGILKARKLPDPNHPLAGVGQAEFMVDMLAHFDEHPVGLAIAGTGSGKTVSALWLAGKRGRSTLAVTDREFLGFEQWIPQAMDKLGIPEDEIGIIQGDVCQYDRPFVVAMAKSLLECEYPPEMYDAFGTMFVDEVHKFGARQMSRIMQCFTAETKCGLTATPKRGDGCQRLFLDYYGPCQIECEGDALPFQLKVVDYIDRTGSGRMPTSHGMRVQRLARDDARNKLCVNEIITMYNEGRTIVVIGDDIKHLQRLEEMCWKLGIPKDETGQFSRERYIFKTHVDTHRGQKMEIKRQKKVRITNEYLNWCKEHARVIFSTYGMMKEGIDIPRLSGGLDVTPRREAIQVVGRIRRNVPGKIKPRWVTIRDRSHEALMRIYGERLRDYMEEKAEILQ